VGTVCILTAAPERREDGSGCVATVRVGHDDAVHYSRRLRIFVSNIGMGRRRLVRLTRKGVASMLGGGFACP
jgi:hypothetical protein